MRAPEAPDKPPPAPPWVDARSPPPPAPPATTRSATIVPLELDAPVLLFVTAKVVAVTTLNINDPLYPDGVKPVITIAVPVVRP